MRAGFIDAFVSPRGSVAITWVLTLVVMLAVVVMLALAMAFLPGVAW